MAQLGPLVPSRLEHWALHRWKMWWYLIFLSVRHPAGIGPVEVHRWTFPQSSKT